MAASPRSIAGRRSTRRRQSDGCALSLRPRCDTPKSTRAGISDKISDRPSPATPSRPAAGHRPAPSPPQPARNAGGREGPARNAGGSPAASRTPKIFECPPQALYAPRSDYIDAVQRDGMSEAWRTKIMAWFGQVRSPRAPRPPARRGRPFEPPQLGDSFKLKRETLSSATNYLDRYLSRRSCGNVNFQRVAGVRKKSPAAAPAPAARPTARFPPSPGDDPRTSTRETTPENLDRRPSPGSRPSRPSSSRARSRRRGRSGRRTS